MLSTLDHGWPGALLAYLLAVLGLLAGLRLRRQPLAGLLPRVLIIAVAAMITALVLWAGIHDLSPHIAKCEGRNGPPPFASSSAWPSSSSWGRSPA